MGRTINKFWMVLGVTIATAFVLGGGSADAARKSTTTVERELQDGVQSAVNWDNECRTSLNADYRAARFNSGGSGLLREGINSGSSYKISTWMSRRGQGNASVPLSVSYGTTAIPLQINDSIFLCGPLVQPDIAASGSACRTNVTGATLLNDSTRWVSSAANANDRNPNSFGGGCMHPSMAFTRRKVVKLTVLSSPWGGTATLDSSSDTLNIWRDDASRYWLSTPVNITYRAATPITGAGTIRIQMQFKNFSAYHTTNEYAATKNCNGAGPKFVTNAYLDVNKCLTQTTTLQMSIVLNSNYSLSPAVSVSPSLMREGDRDLRVVSSVRNTGLTASPDVNWYTTRFVVAPGGNYSLGGAAATACTQFTGYVGGSCQTVRNGTARFSLGVTTVGNFTDTLSSDPPPGSRVCYVTSVDKGSTAAPSWRHSSVSCAMVQRVPFVQVLGNDLRTGSSFTGTNVASGATGLVFANAASWVEYAIMSPGVVSNLASQSGAASGGPASQSAWSKLTFANTSTPAGCLSGYGCFDSASTMGKIPDVRSFVTKAQYNGAALNFNRGSSPFRASDIPTIVTSSDIRNFSRSASITTTGDITIDQDIIYNPGPYSNKKDIPQLILIGNNINIKGNVKQIDAWLIATGSVNTCSDVAQASLRSTNCSEKLLVNGPIMASSLLLNRTFYNAAQPVEAAEALNLRADSYIWADNVAKQNSSWQTVYSTDLPPRY